MIYDPRNFSPFLIYQQMQSSASRFWSSFEVVIDSSTLMSICPCPFETTYIAVTNLHFSKRIKAIINLFPSKPLNSCGTLLVTQRSLKMLSIVFVY